MVDAVGTNNASNRVLFFFFQAEDGIRDRNVTGVQTCALPISAEQLRAALAKASGTAVGVIVSDTFGRPWRDGQVDVALGVAGVGALLDCRGRSDMTGRDLQHTILAVADQLAAAAGLLMEKDSGT